MYAIYKRQENKKDIHFKFLEKISLAGHKHGIIANNLKNKISDNQKPPIGWIIPIAEPYNKNAQSIVIDIKPNNEGSNDIFLCELDTVFGFSYDNWSPIMYRLKIIYDNLPTNTFDKSDFRCPIKLEQDCIIYTFLYLMGSFKNGLLTGTWNYPGPSPTNSVLLWSEAMTFFIKQINVHDKNFLDESINIIS